MLNTCRKCPSTYSSHFIIIYPNLPNLNNVAKVFYAMLCKGAFLMIEIQLVLVQLLKNCMLVLKMLTCRLTVHPNVIQVHSNILIEHIKNTLCIKH